MSQEEYVKVICDQLEIIPKTHCHPPDYRGRIRDMLIGPMWRPQQMGSPKRH